VYATSGLLRCVEMAFDATSNFCHAPCATRPLSFVQHLLLAKSAKDHFEYLASVQRFVSIAVNV
jgi:hypothetical protein